MKNITFIVYHYFPHYRLPLLKNLSEDNEIKYVFFSGENTNIPIKIIDKETAADNKLHWELLENVWLFGKYFLWQRGLLKACAFGKYDCIVFQANPYFLSTWVAIIIAKLRGKKIILWGHFILRNDKRLPIKLALYRMADRLLTYGKWARQQLIKHGFNKDRIFVVFNSLDYELQIEIRKTLTAEFLLHKKKDLFKHPNLPILLFIGRLTKVKKLHLIIKAAAELHLRKKPVNILIIGNGEEYDRLSDLVKTLKLGDYTVFYGETYDEPSIAQLIALSDVCISPGDVGLTAMHAMVYGTPVISHNNPYRQMPEFEAIIPGKTGDLFDPACEGDLTNKIEKWLSYNKNNREQARQACYDVIKKNYHADYQSKIFKKAIVD